MTGSPSLAIFLDGTPPLTADQLTELYRITGRARVELRNAISAGAPLYSAELFGNDHIDVAPRLEKTVDFCLRHDLAFRIEETYDGETETIPLEVMRSVLDAAQGYA